MSTNIPFNGQVYPVPTQGDPAPWGPPLDRYLIALGAGAISPAGGSYPLTADLNLGDNFGVIAKYFTSGSATPATAGTLRLSKGDTIDWRNNANSGDNVLAVNGSDQLTYNGVALQAALGALPDGDIWIGNGSSVPTPQTLSGAITTTDTGVTSISSNYLTNTMVNSAAAIAYSKLNLSGSIVNADIFSGAAIAYSKLNLTGGIVNTDINASAAIAFSKLAALTSAQILVGNGSNVPTAVALSGDATLANTGAMTLATVNSNVGSFTLANITVDAKGRITAAANGSAGAGTVTSVSGTANQITSTNPTTTPVLALASPLTLPGAMTAGGAIAMAANKITGLANGTVSTDAAAFGQIPTVSNGTFTPTMTGLGTLSNAVGFYQQIGNMVHVWGSAQAGTVTAANISIAVPTGSIVFTNRAAGNSSQAVGFFYDLASAAFIFSGNKAGIIFLLSSDTSNVYVAIKTPSGGTAAWPEVTGGAAVSNSDYIAFDFWYAVS